MGDLLTSGSVLAAFFAGGVALFAPCCIVFLLPSYLAAAVKNRRWRLLPLTLAFAAGMAVILVPITLGVRMLASALTRYHVPLYLAGGVLLLGFAALALSGHSWSLPSFIRAPDPERGDSAGVFALGVFSGIASSCCAPVLAGVMTLSALSSSLAMSMLWTSRGYVRANSARTFWASTQKWQAGDVTTVTPTRPARTGELIAMGGGPVSPPSSRRPPTDPMR